MDWREVANSVGGELNRVVQTYHWWAAKDGKSFGEKIRIEIVELSTGEFQGIPDKQVKTPGQATPYVSMDAKATPEEALKDVITGFKMFMDTPENTTWPPLPLT